MEKKSNGDQSSSSTEKKSTEIEFTHAEIEVAEEPPIQIDEMAPGEGIPSQTEDFSLEDAEDLSESVWNVPAAILGAHLEIQKPLSDRFAHPMHRYCQRKGINPFEYLPLGEELPMIFAAMSIVGELRRLHNEHKKEEKKKEYREKSTMEKEEEKEKEEEGVDLH